MNGVKLTKIAKKSKQISHFIDSSSLTNRGLVFGIIGKIIGNMTHNESYMI